MVTNIPKRYFPRQGRTIKHMFDPPSPQPHHYFTVPASLKQKTNDYYQTKLPQEEDSEFLDNIPAYEDFLNDKKFTRFQEINQHPGRCTFEGTKNYFGRFP